MFLSLLTKKEKLKFLDIAVYMIDIEGKPMEVEKKLITRIYGELGREIVEEYTFSKSDSIDQTIEFFKSTNQAVKNIVFLNLVSMSMEDDLYNTLEHLFLEKIEKEFGVSTEKRRDLMQIVYDDRDLKEKAMRVIKS